MGENRLFARRAVAVLLVVMALFFAGCTNNDVAPLFVERAATGTAKAAAATTVPVATVAQTTPVLTIHATTPVPTPSPTKLPTAIATATVAATLKPSNTTAMSTPITPALTPTAVPTEGSADLELVWISASGSKYHRINNCGNMNPDKATQLTFTQAKDKGLEPCKNCKPPS